MFRVLFFLAAIIASGLDIGASPSPPYLDSVDGLKEVNGAVEMVTYRGRRAVHLIPAKGHENTDEAMWAILTGADFTDGTIEVDVAGAPHPGSSPDMRGFIGVLFRAKSKGPQAENFYIRPTNGR